MTSVFAFGLALAGAGAGHAQDADDGMDCVYMELVDQYELVAEVFIYGQLNAEEGARANAALEAAKATCASRHSYTPGQTEAAGALGILASSLDYLSEDLLFSGVSEATIDRVLDAYDGLAVEEADALFDPDWRSDAALVGRMKAKMLGAGIPDETDVMDIALTFLEIAAMVEEESFMFTLE